MLFIWVWRYLAQRYLMGNCKRSTSVILSYFKTLRIGPAPGIEPATSRFAVNRSADWANPAAVKVKVPLLFAAEICFHFLFSCLFSDCPVKYTRVGCFDDSMVQPRPLSQLLMTDRDPTSPVYSGIPVHWGMWDVYFPKLICRCAAKAKAKGYNVFGIQHYGRQRL